MRRSRQVVWSVLMVLALVAAGCGGDDDDTAGGTAAGGATSSAASTGGGEARRVGLVYDAAGRGDKSFNDFAARGLDRAKAEYGLETKDLTPSGGGENRGELLSLLSEQGYPLVFAIGVASGDSLGPVAQRFPDTKYGIVDGFVRQPNVASLDFAENEGSFLVGAAAALKSRTGRIGFIGGAEVDPVEKFEAGYVAGAKEVRPDVQVDVKYVTPAGDPSGFTDPAKGKVVAAGMYGGGADVIFHAAGASGIGLFDAAVEAGPGKWAIGVDADQYLTASAAQKPHILTSMVKSVDVAVYETVKAFQDDNFWDEPQTFDLESGGVGYATSGGFVDDIRPRLEELKRRIVEGSITVPDEVR